MGWHTEWFTLTPRRCLADAGSLSVTHILWQDPSFPGLIPSAYFKPKHNWSTMAFVRIAAGFPRKIMLKAGTRAAQKPEELPRLAVSVSSVAVPSQVGPFKDVA